MVNGVKVANLDEPGTDSLHHFLSCAQSRAPVCLPFEQVTRVKRVGAQLEDTTELTWCCGRPEGELLHERNLLRVDQALQLMVELGELGVVLHAMQ